MIRRLGILAVTAALCGGSAAADPGKSLEPKDRDFITRAAGNGLAEVQVAELGSKKATDRLIQSFAEQMTQDHTKANNELKKLAVSKGVSLPTEVPQEAKTALNKLQGLTDAQFNDAFMKQMVDDHERVVRDLKHADVHDADLKAYVQKTLPTVEDHLEMAKEIHKAPSAEPALDDHE